MLKGGQQGLTRDHGEGEGVEGERIGTRGLDEGRGEDMIVSERTQARLTGISSLAAKNA